MPSYEEVAAMGSKPFVPPATSRLQAAPADLASALGVSLEDNDDTDDTTTDDKPSVDLAAEQKANEEAEKVIKNRSAKIQQTTEELYRIEERTALKDETYLQKLINSKDALDRKNAEKILKRNAETFGASSIEEYEIVLAKNATTDPTEKKLAELDIKTKSLDQKIKNSEWSEWKKANSVGSDIDAIADEIHATYPTMPHGDVVAMARGKAGLSQPISKKGSGSTVGGGAGAPEMDDSAYTSTLAKRLIKNPESTMKFAKGYLRSLNS